jgi:hypothetical protein
MDNITGLKLLNWAKGLKINVIRILDGPDSFGLIQIEYKVIHGKKFYTLWCYPEDLK